MVLTLREVVNVSKNKRNNQKQINIKKIQLKKLDLSVDDIRNVDISKQLKKFEQG